ncbi:MAG: hypothetical protein GTO18_14005 [Anaerolineales bacterium]|nr:hypothetical protein [Anaerolineales bacterium]
MLTIFSPPKPFDGHIGLIQRNAIKSWLQLGIDIEVLLIGDEEGIEETARELGVRHLSGVERNEQGTPLVNSIFQLAESKGGSSTFCYVNADMIFTQDLLSSASIVSERFERFLLIGQRWDLKVEEPLSFVEGWENDLRREIQKRGSLHPPAGSDYFIYPRGLFENMPPFALGRAGWDNWMIFAARSNGVPVVDATKAITTVHQDHDYGHLPGGQPHYGLPESKENVRLAGGQEVIFTLHDADWTITEDGLRKKPLHKRWNLRGLEASMIARFGAGKSSRAVRLILHPRDGWLYLRQLVNHRLLGNQGSQTKSIDSRS